MHLLSLVLERVALAFVGAGVKRVADDAELLFEAPGNESRLPGAGDSHDSNKMVIWTNWTSAILVHTA